MTRRITKKGAWRVSEILTMLFIVAAGLGAISRAESDPENLMVVKRILVPDYSQDQPPKVIFDRIIKKPFESTRLIEVYSIGENAVVCSDSSLRTYAVADGFQEMSLPLEMESCPLGPGEYVARVTWLIDGHADLRASSDVFAVYPAF